jgi:hypothetical protein
MKQEDTRLEEKAVVITVIQIVDGVGLGFRVFMNPKPGVVHVSFRLIPYQQEC